MGWRKTVQYCGEPEAPVQAVIPFAFHVDPADSRQEARLNIDPVTLVLLAFFAILLFFLLPVIQRLLTEEFRWPFLFRAGVLVCSEIRSLSRPSLQKGSVFVTESGRFMYVDTEQCLFHPVPDEKSSEWDTITWFMGRILWEGERARVEVRIPIIMVLYAFVIPAGLTCYASGRDIVQFRNWAPIDSTVFILLLWISVAALILAIGTTARGNASNILDEYEAYVSSKRDLWDVPPRVHL